MRRARRSSDSSSCSSSFLSVTGAPRYHHGALANSVSLDLGARFGPHEIRSALCASGTGEVYPTSCRIKVGIYHELGASDALGGTERAVAVLAEALQHRYQVEILNHSPTLTIQKLAEFAEANLVGVRLRNTPQSPEPDSSSRNLWRRYHQAKAWHASLSEPYDLFINFAHGLPPFCHAAKGVLVVLFPFFRPLDIGVASSSHVAEGSLLRQYLRRSYHRWEWKRRMSSYQLALATSQFTRLWTGRWWDIDCRVVYPPVETGSRRVNKKNIILSVGRFSTQWHRKKQAEMAGAFRQLHTSLPTWEYLCVGGLSDLQPDRDFFAAVQGLAAGYRVRALPNIQTAELKRMYEQAKIFWHATGYGEDDQAHPDLAEHFGIVTGEAMTAGCVPVVINKGAQPEIVQHGVNGLLWNTLEELRDYTLMLAGDEQLLARMSEAARLRANRFSRENFVKQLLVLIEPLVDQVQSISRVGVASQPPMRNARLESTRKGLPRRGQL
jgi:glycosyltransferase involved in cell wall biosynthesis